MDSIPSLVLLLPYGFILFVAALFLFFNIFHLWRYGIEGMGTRLLMLAYIGLFAVTVGGTLMALGGYAWGGTFSLTDLLLSSRGISSFGL